MLNREQILGAQDLTRKEVEVPEWGGSVFVRQLTGGELVKLQRLLSSDNVLDLVPLVVMCTVDENGKRIFSDKDVEALAAKNGRVLERIATACLSINYLDSESREEVKKD
jgi:hypothetical protein